MCSMENQPAAAQEHMQRPLPHQEYLCFRVEALRRVSYQEPALSGLAAGGGICSAKRCKVWCGFLAALSKAGVNSRLFFNCCSLTDRKRVKQQGLRKNDDGGLRNYEDDQVPRTLAAGTACHRVRLSSSLRREVAKLCAG